MKGKNYRVESLYYGSGEIIIRVKSQHKTVFLALAAADKIFGPVRVVDRKGCVWEYTSGGRDAAFIYGKVPATDDWDTQRRQEKWTETQARDSVAV